MRLALRGHRTTNEVLGISRSCQLLPLLAPVSLEQPSRISAAILAQVSNSRVDSWPAPTASTTLSGCATGYDDVK